jgi:deoxyribonuclease V
MDTSRALKGRTVWPRNARQAVAIQRRLRRLVRTGGPCPRVRLIAGADIAYDPRNGWLFAAVLVFSFPDLEPREIRSVRARARFPYVPGLLSFREAPALIRAFRRLRIPPDLLICDGQGIAHPRGIGLASHLGILLGVPTIGCAKSRLVGDHGEVGPNVGDRSPLLFERRVVGAVVRSRSGVRPLFISPGHRISLDRSIRYVLASCRGFRLPEPTRQADILVERLKRGASLSSARAASSRIRNGERALRNASRDRIWPGVSHERIARGAT